MAQKARVSDAQPDRILWLKDHGVWVRVVVESSALGGKGWKVTFRRSDGSVGKQALSAFYRDAPARS